MANVSDKELEKLVDELRENLSDLTLDSWTKTELYLTNWIKFGGYDVKKAEAGLRKCLKWRYDNEIDTILEENLPYKEEIPYELKGFDKYGWPVIMVYPGKWQLKKLLEKEPEADVLRYLIQILAAVDNQLKTAYFNKLENSGSSQFFNSGGLAIYDFQGMSLGHFSSVKCVRTITNFVSAGEANFPRYGYSIRAIHVNSVVRALMKIITPFLNKITLAQFKFMGSDKNEWREEFSKFLDLKDLPIQYGGTGGVLHSTSKS